MRTNGIKNKLPPFAILSNLSLRILSLFSRFLLIILLAKYLSASEVGQYGILQTTILYLLFFIGLDFYTYSTRKLLTSNDHTAVFIVKNQFIFYLLAYLLFLPVLLILRFFDFFPNDFFYFFLAILFFEHIGQECNRYLVAIGKPVSGSFVLFLKGALWAIVLLPAWWFDFASTQLSTVLLLWTISAGAGVIFGFSVILGTLDMSSFFNVNIDWRWIKRGISASGVFFLATLISRLPFVADRYWSMHFFGDEMTGIYTFFINLSNVMLAFVDAAIISFIYPKMLSHHNNSAKLSELKRTMGFSILACGVFLAFAFAVFLEPMLALIGNEIYVGQTVLLAVLLAATFLICLSYTAHFPLYARGGDKLILLSSLIYLCSFLLALVLFREKQLIGIACAHLFAALVLFSSKSLCYHWLLKYRKAS
jgi:O-antigen/teichoic acid export membrane protein